MGEPESRGFAAATSASTGGGTRTGEGGHRDRDAAPGYDGENPEVTFRQYEKQIALWQFETETPKAKRGVRMVRQLTGIAALAVDDLAVDDIACENGAKNVLNRLREYFNPHLEVSLPRAFETAVYGAPRGPKKSFAEYTKRMERGFMNLATEGVDLPDGAKGYIMYRQAALTEAQDQRLLTWAEGKYGRSEITNALRRLDRVMREKEKAKSGLITEEHYVHEYNPGGSYEAEEPEYLEGGDEEDNYIYLADGDLDEVMDEQDVQSALAAYNDTRQALKDQRLNRGYYPGKGKGKVNSFQNGKDKCKRRVHVEQLKLRTRCRRCRQIGHWERECQNPPAAQASKPESRAFFVGLRPESQNSPRQPHQFWLRQFVKDQRAREDESVSGHGAKSSEQYMERACVDQEVDMQFCGITTKAIEGVVDTAAALSIEG